MTKLQLKQLIKETINEGKDIIPSWKEIMEAIDTLEKYVNGGNGDQKKVKIIYQNLLAIINDIKKSNTEQNDYDNFNGFEDN